jgi:hypothetical protein
LLLPAAGAGCSLDRRGYVAPAPVVFARPPSLAEIIHVVNTNSARVQQIRADSARLSVSGLVTSLQATLDFDRPRRFRLLGSSSFTGPELDLGSNDEIYWMWLKRSEPPTVYYGRHDEFFSTAAQEVLPVPPQWLMEALGVVFLDPSGAHEGPSYVTTPAGALEVRSKLSSPKGELTRILLVDQQRGWIVQQHLLDARGQLLAAAAASDFRYDARHGVSLPGRIDITLPLAQLAFSFEADRYVINEPYVSDDPRPRRNPRELWNMPQLPGGQYRDLGDPQTLRDLVLPWQATPEGPTSPPAASAAQPPASPADPSSGPPRAAHWLGRPPRAALRRIPPFSVIR